MLCKYCNSLMEGTFASSPGDEHRYKAFYTCPKCGSLCDCEIIEKKNEQIITDEQWLESNKENKKVKKNDTTN